MALVLTLVAPVQAQEREDTTIASQGARASSAFGINSRGDVVGTFVDQNFVQHGFLLSKQGEFTVIDFPEAPSMSADIQSGVVSTGYLLSHEKVQ